MGREIRRVPPDWEHPTQPCPHSPWQGGCSHARANSGRCYQPLHNKSFKEAARKWLDDAIAWDKNTNPEDAEDRAKYPFYWQWDGMPPDPKYYRPEWTSEPTHYQVYETVSEGTPVTPHFATKEELVDYLVKYGDEWDQIRAAEGRQSSVGWSRKNAEDFVGREWAPSMILADGQIFEPKNMADVLGKK